MKSITIQLDENLSNKDFSNMVTELKIVIDKYNTNKNHDNKVITEAPKKELPERKLINFKYARNKVKYGRLSSDYSVTSSGFSCTARFFIDDVYTDLTIIYKNMAKIKVILNKYKSKRSRVITFSDILFEGNTTEYNKFLNNNSLKYPLTKVIKDLNTNSFKILKRGYF